MSSIRDRQGTPDHHGPLDHHGNRPVPQASRLSWARRHRLTLGAVVAVLLVIGVVAILVQHLGANSSASSCTVAPPAPGQPAAKTYPCPKPDLAAASTWTAKVTTSAGDLVLELDGKAAPETVASFISLSRSTFYDDTRCHRLTTDGIFVLQCGDPTATGSGGPGYEYDIENAPQPRGTGTAAYGDYPAGTLAMARGQSPHSNGSQFFMVYQDTRLPAIGGGYTVFGRVSSGLDVLQTIAKKGTDNGTNDGAPQQPVTIKSITVEKQ